MPRDGGIDGCTAVLVREDVELAPTTTRVEVTPGNATFDGDRWRWSLHVTVTADGERECDRFGRRALQDGVDFARRAVVVRAPAVVALRRRPALYTFLPSRTVHRIERRLADAAAIAGSTLVARARRDDPDDCDPYECVIDRYDGVP